MQLNTQIAIMTRVIIAPASNADSRRHFVDTIENPVNIAEYKDFFGSEYETLDRLSDNGKIALWGVTPGKNASNESKYSKFSIGDMVFFTRDNKVFYTAEISHLFRNEKLAKQIWGVKNTNQTWENMFSLAKVKPQNISYAALRKAIGSADGDNFMGIRPLDLGKSKKALTLLGIDDATWDIEVGDEIRRTELQDRYGGGRFGGIEPSATTPNVLLFASSYGDAFGYDFNEELEDGSFLFTGDGQTGSQSADKGGNKAILEHQSKGRSLRLFEQTSKKTFVRYLGEFEHDGKKPESRTSLDRDKKQRTVLVFRLTPVGKTVNRSRDNVEKKAATVIFQEPEKNISKTHERSVPATTTIAQRREGQLQNRYIEYLRNQGVKVGTFQINIPESNAPLRVDLIDYSKNRIIEVKAGVSRGYVREAVGQVLEYVYHLKRIKNQSWNPVILLPAKPTDDLIGFVESLGIELIWEEAPNFKNSQMGSTHQFS